VNEVGVLALPAQPRRLGEGFFHHRRGIDEDLQVIARRCQPVAELLEAALDRVVIVLALRVDRDDTGVGVIGVAQRIERRGIAGAEHHHRAHLGPQALRRGAAVGGVGHPDHVAVAAIHEPFA
jgi:hypothetical protein